MFLPCLVAATTLPMHFPTPALPGSGTKGLISAPERGTPKQSGNHEKERNKDQIQSEMALLQRRILAPTYSPTTKGSTIGAAGLNDSVRNGRGVSPAL